MTEGSTHLFEISGPSLLSWSCSRLKFLLRVFDSECKPVSLMGAVSRIPRWVLLFPIEIVVHENTSPDISWLTISFMAGSRFKEKDACHRSKIHASTCDLQRLTQFICESPSFICYVCKQKMPTNCKRSSIHAFGWLRYTVIPSALPVAIQIAKSSPVSIREIGTAI